MARLAHHRSYLTLPVLRPLNSGQALFILTQLAVLGGIAFFIALAVVNTILGTPQAEPVYSPYQ